MPLEIVLRVSRFEPTLNWNRFLTDQQFEFFNVGLCMLLSDIFLLLTLFSLTSGLLTGCMGGGVNPPLFSYCDTNL